MSLLSKIFIAYILDLIFGDPINVTHPVQIIGKLIDFLEKKLYTKKEEETKEFDVEEKKIGKDKNNKTSKNISQEIKKRNFWNGMLMNICVIFITFVSMLILEKLSQKNIIFTFFEIYLMYTIFSINSLAREGKKVYKILQKGNLEIARKELSYLVSRDTEKMDKIMIIRSTMETISENTVDGIIAPMFYMFIGGLPLAMTYKAINTMDSMVGYKNEKYMDFGKFSAKIDDIANFIPARITGILIIISSFLLGFDYKNARKIFFRDRKNHSSPNSAHSEASVAGALGVQFGGKVSYFGKEVEKPTIGDKKKEFRTEDIRKNIRIMYVTSFVGLVIFSLIRFIIFKIL